MKRRLPATAAGCPVDRARCPYSSCRYNLALEITQRGSISFTEREGCALDFADRGPATLDEIAERMNLVGERARQVEAEALRKARAALEAMGVELADLLPSPPPPGEEQWPAPAPGVVAFHRELRLKMIERSWWRLKARRVRRWVVPLSRGNVLP